ncbi:hypothetical protein [Nannocystis radixulma]|uniref:Uncharacterized protein n=1 Tax=Nannocystis radixulma TaxID=2995305 RepID=A0ABT5BJU3_9BACT|nr:hypothetical protein [Nannocystis radixulma]MDC0673282.1 hypothetical protein [Nannocystis radixulma]
MSLTLHTNLRAVLLAACTLTLAACPEGGKETETGTATEPTTEAATETGTESVSSTMTPTDGGPTEGTMTAGMTESTTQPDGSTETASTSETMGGETTAVTTESTTAVDTETEGDTGVVPPELDAACTAACDKFFECIEMPPFPDLATCAGECADSLGGGEGCLEATVAFNNCVGTFTCDQLDTALAEEEFGPCADEFDAMNATCASSLCEGFGSNNGADACSIGQQCEGQPPQEFKCEGDTCTCLVNDQAQSECDAVPGFCGLDFADQAQAAFECCGFEL